MKPANSPNRKGIKFLEPKILIATLALAVTLGLWNLLASELYESEKPAPPAFISGAPAENQDLPPLATLVPVVITDGQPGAAAQPAAQQPGGLRSVAAPTVTIVQKNIPLIDAPAAPGSGGGGTSRSVSRTRSSR